MTYERVRVAKEYIEKKYRLKKEEEQEKKRGKIIIIIFIYRLGRNNVSYESIKFTRRRSRKNKRRNIT